jgi:hypothetical protein
MSSAMSIRDPQSGDGDTRVVAFDRVEPDREQIVRLLRLVAERPAHRRWFGMLDGLLKELPRLMRPRGVYRIDEVVTLEPGRLVLQSGAVFAGAVGEFLAHARMVATYVVTIGSAVERLARRWLRAGRVMHGTVADAIASEAVEAAAQRLQDEVRAAVRPQGLDTTLPYSPGYCGLTLRMQEPLFASLPVRRINVRLTPSCLMLPVKSISGLIGIGPAGLVSPEGVPCAACDHPDCVQRRGPLRA